MAFLDIIRMAFCLLFLLVSMSRQQRFYPVVLDLIFFPYQFLFNCLAFLNVGFSMIFYSLFTSIFAGHPALTARHRPFPVTHRAAERWLHHMQQALESTPDIDADSKVRMMNFFRYKFLEVPLAHIQAWLGYGKVFRAFHIDTSHHNLFHIIYQLIFI